VSTPIILIHHPCHLFDSDQSIVRAGRIFLFAKADVAHSPPAAISIRSFNSTCLLIAIVRPLSSNNSTLHVQLSLFKNELSKLRLLSSNLLGFNGTSKLPVSTFGSLTFIRFLICFPNISTNATLPSLLGGAPLKIDFRLSLSARQAVSREFSAPAEPPDCAEASQTDCPMSTTQGMSAVLCGPWPASKACTAARDFSFPVTWSIF